MKAGLLLSVLLGVGLSFVEGGRQQELDTADDADGTSTTIIVTNEACEACFEDLVDARNCLRVCNNKNHTDNRGMNQGSLLAWCLEEDQDVTEFDDLIDCCEFDRDDCEDDLEETYACLGECLDDCLSVTSIEYLLCVQDETGGGACNLGSCIDSILSDEIEEDLGLEDLELGEDFETDNFVEVIEELEKDVTNPRRNECRVFKDFVQGSCEIGDACCEDCQEELSVVLDCLINDIAVPFLELQLNETMDVCTIEEDCDIDLPRPPRPPRPVANSTGGAPGGEAGTGGAPGGEAGTGGGGRHLSEETVSKVYSLPRRMSRRGGKRDNLVHKAQKMGRRLNKNNATAAVELCEAKMTTDMITTNVTHATSMFMECVAASAIMILEGETSSAAAYGMMSTLFVVIGSLAYLW